MNTTFLNRFFIFFILILANHFAGFAQISNDSEIQLIKKLLLSGTVKAVTVQAGTQLHHKYTVDKTARTVTVFDYQNNRIDVKRVFTYDKNNDLKSEQHYMNFAPEGKKAPVASDFVLSERSVYEYANGRLKSVRTVLIDEMAGNAGSPFRDMDYTYNAKGDLVKQVTKNYNVYDKKLARTKEQVEVKEFSYGKDSVTFTISIDNKPGQKGSFAKDGEGKLLKERIFQQEQKQYIAATYTYDAAGRLTEKQVTYQPNTVKNGLTREVYKYDAKSNVIERQEYRAGQAVQVYKYSYEFF